MKVFIYILSIVIFCLFIFLKNDENLKNTAKYRENHDLVMSVWYLYQSGALDTISPEYNLNKTQIRPLEFLELQKHEIKKLFAKGELNKKNNTLLKEWMRDQNKSLSLLHILQNNDLSKVNVVDILDFKSILKGEEDDINEEGKNYDLLESIGILDKQKSILNDIN